MDKYKADWEAYRRAALPEEVSEVHLQIARNAFYAGAESVAVEALATMPPLPDDPQWLTKLQGDIPAGSPFYASQPDATD